MGAFFAVIVMICYYLALGIVYVLYYVGVGLFMLVGAVFSGVAGMVEEKKVAPAVASKMVSPTQIKRDTKRTVTTMRSSGSAGRAEMRRLVG